MMNSPNQRDRVPVREINPGMYVRRKDNPGTVFIVTENQGDRLLAVAVVTAMFLDDWEVLDARANFPTFKPIQKPRRRRAR